MNLVREIFAVDPTFPRTKPTMARRAATLLWLKAPDQIAVVFSTQPNGGEAAMVAARLVAVEPSALDHLKKLQDAGTLTRDGVDAQIWPREPMLVES